MEEEIKYYAELFEVEEKVIEEILEEMYENDCYTSYYDFFQNNSEWEIAMDIKNQLNRG